MILSKTLSFNQSDNKRMFFRVKLCKPLCTDISIVKHKGKYLNTAETKVCVTDIGQGGLAFVSLLKLPTGIETIYSFKVVLFEKTFYKSGTLVRVSQDKNGVYQYGVSFSLNDSDSAHTFTTLNQLAINLKRGTMYSKCSFCKEESFPCKSK